ncbi:hypothetical protein WN51_08686 [Melipona quadrifasciata]|uniref:Uncharacterized protein n=1 Tax=Melipona quadrifasciata TaxID=166423 RepID=A0A0M9A7Q1_9HYME|nr:hypothetical protein WN51_08686 [Melipona quadrifasciata]
MEGRRIVHVFLQLRCVVAFIFGEYVIEAMGGRRARDFVEGMFTSHFYEK